ASQVRYRGEDVAGNDLTLDFGKPGLDLVKPGRIRRGEVKLHAGMLLQEVANELSFVGGEIVEDDMNLLPGRAQRYHFLEEGNEVTAGVGGGGFLAASGALCVH